MLNRLAGLIIAVRKWQCDTTRLPRIKLQRPSSLSRQLEQVHLSPGRLDEPAVQIGQARVVVGQVPVSKRQVGLDHLLVAARPRHELAGVRLDPLGLDRTSSTRPGATKLLYVTFLASDRVSMLWAKSSLVRTRHMQAAAWPRSSHAREYREVGK